MRAPQLIPTKAASSCMCAHLKLILRRTFSTCSRRAKQTPRHVRKIVRPAPREYNELFTAACCMCERKAAAVFFAAFVASAKWMEQPVSHLIYFASFTLQVESDPSTAQVAPFFLRFVFLWFARLWKEYSHTHKQQRDFLTDELLCLRFGVLCSLWLLSCRAAVRGEFSRFEIWSPTAAYKFIWHIWHWLLRQYITWLGPARLALLFSYTLCARRRRPAALSQLQKLRLRASNLARRPRALPEADAHQKAAEVVPFCNCSQWRTWLLELFCLTWVALWWVWKLHNIMLDPRLSF